MAQARALTHHPRIDVTGLEAVINTRYTYDTLDFLKRRCPDVRFVWVMGADNLRSFYRWQNWRGIANLMPMAVVDRMGSSLFTPPAAVRHRRWAATGCRSGDASPASPIASRRPGFICTASKSPLSSTALRALRQVAGRKRAGFHAYL